MDFLLQAVDLFRHLDKHLLQLAHDYGVWTYAILALVVFCETGLVVTPFLPGDSLLFAAGTLCATQTGDGDTVLQLQVLIPALLLATFLGDNVNYAVGWLVGPGFLEKGKIRFIKKAHLEKTQGFYAKYGGKTIVMARFVPIVRTFAPFVAGLSRMPYRKFIGYSVTGAVAWVLVCACAGYFFGQIPIVQRNFELVVLGIIGISVLPIAIEALKARRQAKTNAP